MSRALDDFNYGSTPQNERAREDQVRNNAGGFVFSVTPESRLRRFLTIGTDGGTYYVAQQKLTKENAQVVVDYAQRDPRGLVDIVKEISLGGRAPKQDQGIFALAVATALATKPADKAYAYAAVPEVCRTATTLFMFIKYREAFAGWGHGMARAVANWYTSKEADQLAYQMVKYRNREGWTHGDVLRSAHPKLDDVSPAHKALAQWALKGNVTDDVPELVNTFQELQAATTSSEWVNLIRENKNVTHEMLPDAAKGSKDVWAALVDNGMPLTAMLRNLGKLSSIGLLVPNSSYTRKVVNSLTDAEYLKKSRIHPFAVLMAMKVYQSGHGVKGSLSWSPAGRIVDALDQAFYGSYGNVEPTGKRHLLALDVSGSMGWQYNGVISAREISAAIALVTANVEKDYEFVGFCNELRSLNISPRQRLDDVIHTISGLPFGSTDCALPALWAAKHGYEFDAISIYTDNETWAGRNGHPFQALKKYRQKTGLPVKQVVVATDATSFSIADPSDPLSLDISGFDASTPQVMSDFFRA